MHGGLAGFAHHHGRLHRDFWPEAPHYSDHWSTNPQFLISTHSCSIQLHPYRNQDQAFQACLLNGLPCTNQSSTESLSTHEPLNIDKSSMANKILLSFGMRRPVRAIQEEAGDAIHKPGLLQLALRTPALN